MSHRLKKPPKIGKRPYVPKRAGVKGKLDRYAALIENQEQLDRILGQVPADVGEAWLNLMRPHFKFVPRQFAEQKEEVHECSDDSLRLSPSEQGVL